MEFSENKALRMTLMTKKALFYSLSRKPGLAVATGFRGEVRIFQRFPSARSGPQPPILFLPLTRPTKYHSRRDSAYGIPLRQTTSIIKQGLKPMRKQEGTRTLSVAYC